MDDTTRSSRGEADMAPPRIDGRLKVTGACRYAADFRLRGLAHAVMVTSDIARGRIEAVDMDAARAVPGVLDILSHGDMEGVNPPGFGTSSFTSLGPLHTQDIVHDGQIVALVVAESYEAACEGAEAVAITYAREPAAGTLSADGVEVEEDEDSAVSTGDFDAIFADAPVQLDLEYHTASETHNAIELFSTTCVWEEGRLTVYEPSQNVFGFRGQIAAQLGIEPGLVRVISPYVGGGFGSKGPITPRTAIVAVAARRLGRPVRCVATRMQGYTTTSYRAETRQRVRIGAHRDGRIAAFGHDGWELTSRTDDYITGGNDLTVRLYGYDAVCARTYAVRTDRQTPGYMRSPPETPYVFALETALDELAEKLRIDPVALRRINDTDIDPVSRKTYTSRSLMQCYDAASDAFGWSRRNPAPRSMRDGEWLVGFGCATATYPTHVAAATARVRFGADGSVLVESASHEIGTGIRTVAAQMAAERLGVPLSSVSVAMGDTDLPPAPVSGGSNSTASVCSAVMQACDRIRDRLFRAAPADSRLGNGDPDSFRIKDGAVRAGENRILGIEEVFRSMGAGMIEEYAEFVPAGAPDDAIRKLYDGKTSMVGEYMGSKLMYAFGAIFVEVRVHSRTREIRVPRMTGAFAAGRIMNPRTARSQLMGGMIWGMSCALLEETQIDPHTARYVNRDLQDYLLPVNADIGEVDVLFVPEEDNEVNPAGVKGLGELGNVGTNAAVANAVYHATGKRVRHFPIRIEDLLETG
ncbi:MAG: xanthine dehydrogenase family protein molybdopterin-binding subunit [Alphaproteobacteria bacterium]